MGWLASRVLRKSRCARLATARKWLRMRDKRERAGLSGNTPKCGVHYVGMGLRAPQRYASGHGCQGQPWQPWSKALARFSWRCRCYWDYGSTCTAGGIASAAIYRSDHTRSDLLCAWREHGMSKSAARVQHQLGHSLIYPAHMQPHTRARTRTQSTHSNAHSHSHTHTCAHTRAHDAL